MDARSLPNCGSGRSALGGIVWLWSAKVEMSALDIGSNRYEEKKEAMFKVVLEGR